MQQFCPCWMFLSEIQMEKTSCEIGKVLFNDALIFIYGYMASDILSASKYSKLIMYQIQRTISD